MPIPPSRDPAQKPNPARPVALPFALILLSLIVTLALGALNGCAAGNSAQPTPTRTRKPTFTPVPPIPTATELPLRPIATLAPAATSAPDTAAVNPTVETAAITTPTPAGIPAATAAPAAAEAQLTITADTANARQGPGTDYDIVGKASGGQSFKVTGKSAAGDWWQVCCVSDQPAWIAASLAQVTNGEVVPVVAAPALAVAAPAPTAAPVAAAPTAVPAPKQPPAAADPCANIGGDGCKWKMTGGPKTADNGGNELKLQFSFIHSGIDGGQPQGSYFVVMEKDGQRLPIPDSVRSIGLQANQGSLGKYNYEFVLSLNKLPGGTVAGNYTLWVLDGNGERDSRNINFTIGAGQGLLWIQFDQA